MKVIYTNIYRRTYPSPINEFNGKIHPPAKFDIQTMEKRGKPEEVCSSPCSLLIVDSDPHILRRLRLSIERTGHLTWLALGKDQALRLAEGKASIDGLIVRTVLPHLNGIDLCRRIRRTLPDVGAIVVTSFADNGQGGQATYIESEGLYLLTEPCTPEHIGRFLPLLLNRKHSKVASDR